MLRSFSTEPSLVGRIMPRREQVEELLALRPSWAPSGSEGVHKGEMQGRFGGLEPALSSLGNLLCLDSVKNSKPVT